MIALAPPKVVVLGMITKMPVAGVVWQVMHYLEGLRRMGFDPYYVEAHSRTPSMFMGAAGEDGSEAAADFLNVLMGQFGFQDRWAYHALHSDGRCLGLSRSALFRLYESSELLLNLHGGTQPQPEHVKTGRLVYVGTDPVQLEVELFHENRDTIDFLSAHSHHFSFGENYGNSDCLLPVTDRFDLLPTRQPVVLDFWGYGADTGTFTTVGNWRQEIRDLQFRGETYTWSKHDQFERIIDLPSRSGADLELALASVTEEDRSRLIGRGWRIRDAHALSADHDLYRAYISTSGGEFTVAKDQNVRFRSGWFSDRSATYLAAGRPVVTQDTGFASVLPTGRGLLGFHDLDSAAAALDKVLTEPAAHRAAAREIALECFDHRVVLGPLMSAAGARMPGRASPLRRDEPATATPTCRIPRELLLTPASRHPLRLQASTERMVRELGIGSLACRTPSSRIVTTPLRPEASVILLTHNQLQLTRLCLASVFGNTEADFEIIVVDNASTDGSPRFLGELSRNDPRVRVVLNPENRGFAAGNNQALKMARGQTLVLLNNDTVVSPGWLRRLRRHLEVADVGAVGPVTNRTGNEAQVETSYETYGEFLAFAADRAGTRVGEYLSIPVLTMFCFALDRAVFETVGWLDEDFGVGTLEDDDYSRRIRNLGLDLRCAEDAFVHHFGRASFGEMVASGDYGRLLAENQKKFKKKWGQPWMPYHRRPGDAYASLTGRVRALVDRYVPESATVLVVSRGDDELVELDGRRGWHLPQASDGGYAGYYPRDSGEAIEHLEALREKGGQFLVFPTTASWWLDYYEGLRLHLESSYREVVKDDDTATIYALDGVGT